MNFDPWIAILQRDPAFDGRLFYGVTSTGVYCRPSCPSRRPLRKNVRFLPSAAAASRSSFTRCPLTVVSLGAIPAPAGSGAAANSAASAGCGRISTFDVSPRGDRQYHALILLLDGVTPGPSGGEVYRVTAGEHRLLVAENIPTRQMGFSEIASLRRKTSKELIVTVKPDTTAMVAAQYHMDKGGDLAHGTYWDPVVWREVPETCP